MTVLNPSTPLGAGIEDIRKHRGWFLALGIALIILGTFALVSTFAATLATALLLGWILIVSAVAHLVEAFQTRTWRGVIWQVLLGIIDLAVGVYLVMFPLGGAIKLTLVLAIFFVAEGIVQILAGAAGKLPNRGWQMFSGLITVLLGVLVISEWPYSGVWFLGMCLGIGLIFRGWALVALSSVAKRIGAPA